MLHHSGLYISPSHTWSIWRTGNSLHPIGYNYQTQALTQPLSQQEHSTFLPRGTKTLHKKGAGKQRDRETKRFSWDYPGESWQSNKTPQVSQNRVQKSTILSSNLLRIKIDFDNEKQTQIKTTPCRETPLLPWSPQGLKGKHLLFLWPQLLLTLFLRWWGSALPTFWPHFSTSQDQNMLHGSI